MFIQPLAHWKIMIYLFLLSQTQVKQIPAYQQLDQFLNQRKKKNNRKSVKGNQLEQSSQCSTLTIFYFLSCFITQLPNNVFQSSGQVLVKLYRKEKNINFISTKEHAWTNLIQTQLSSNTTYPIHRLIDKTKNCHVRPNVKHHVSLLCIAKQQQ